MVRDGNHAQPSRPGRHPSLPAEHLISGLLVDGASAFPGDIFALGYGGGVTFFACPQGSGRIRLYLCQAPHPHDRFAGARGTATFLRSCHLGSQPHKRFAASAADAAIGTVETRYFAPGDWQPDDVRGAALIGEAPKAIRG